MGRRETMRLEKYRAEYSGAPIDLNEFAFGAAQIVDCEALQSAARAFLDAKRELKHQLRSHGVEIG